MRRSSRERRAIALAFFAILITFLLGLMEAPGPGTEPLQEATHASAGQGDGK